MKISIFIQLIIVYTQQNAVAPKKSAGSDKNPNFIRDRSTDLIEKPDMPTSWLERFVPPFDPQWMDYCDPHHCKYFERNVCGLHRRRMRFKMFRSMCHLILNNKCSVYRGFFKYDLVDLKFCHLYKVGLRTGCPDVEECADNELSPICAMNSIDGHIVLFENQCYMEAINCKNSTFSEYEETYMSFCETGLHMNLTINTKEENKNILLDDD